MNPTTFPESTKTLAKPRSMTDEECGPLPVYVTDEDDFAIGVVISCWRMSWRERLSALLSGRVWLSVWSGVTQPPVALTVKRTIFGKTGGGS